MGAINQNDRSLSDTIRRTDLTNGGDVSGALSVTGQLTVGSIKFTGDNTVQVSSPAVWIDTFTSVEVGNVALASGSGACDSDISTRTVTLSYEGSVEVGVIGVFFLDTGGQYFGWSVLVDGRYVNSASLGFPNFFSYFPTANVETMLGTSMPVMNLSAGTHTFCWVFHTTGGAVGRTSPNVGKNIFYVKGRIRT